MPMSIGRARQNAVDRKKQEARKRLDPLVCIHEWAIPNAQVMCEQERKLRDANCWLGWMQGISGFLGLLAALSGILLPAIIVTALLVISGGTDSKAMDIIGMVFLLSMSVCVLSTWVTIRIGSIQTLPFQWQRECIFDFGWNNVPVEAAKRASFVEEHFPDAFIAVDFLGVDPYLVAIIDDCEYFLYQWG